MLSTNNKKAIHLFRIVIIYRNYRVTSRFESLTAQFLFQPYCLILMFNLKLKSNENYGMKLENVYDIFDTLN